METIEKFPDNAVYEPDSIFFPRETVVFGVTLHCMNPIIRAGQKVFAVPHYGFDIANGTPVVVKTRGKGLLCKVWKGRKGGSVTLGFYNDQPFGKPGITTVPINDIEEVWRILGIWFDGIMPDEGKTVIFGIANANEPTREAQSLPKEAKRPAKPASIAQKPGKTAAKRSA
jgi:hypothetical protein